MVNERIKLSAFPAVLRKSALQILAVSEGLKPASFFRVQYRDVPACLNFLKGLGLFVAIAESSSGAQSFSHLGPVASLNYGNLKRLKICIALKKINAQILAGLREAQQLEAVGVSLGYPECCIKATKLSDEGVNAHLYPSGIKHNLRLHAIDGSEWLDWRTNTFLDESLLASECPSSLIAHYPCSYNCSESIGIADSFLEICALYWPEWSTSLTALLNSLQVYFPATTWPDTYRDDTCGICFPNCSAERILQERILEPAASCFVTGLGLTPYGTLPQDINLLVKNNNTLFIHTHQGQALNIPIKHYSDAWLLDWRNKKLISLFSGI